MAHSHYQEEHLMAGGLGMPPSLYSRALETAVGLFTQAQNSLRPKLSDERQKHSHDMANRYSAPEKNQVPAPMYLAIANSRI